MTYAILMLTHNRVDDVKRCFASLEATLHRYSDVRFIVLDNASTDGTREYLNEECWVRYHHTIFWDENLGVSQGRAYLLNALKEYEYEHDTIIFLDSDVVIMDDRWLDVLGKALEPENVGLVGPGGSMVLPDWSNFTAAMPNTECDCVSGACQAFKREVLKVAHLDTEYGMFWTEDSDFCMQIREAGYDILCVPCGVLHEPGESGDVPGLHERNLQRFRDKWAGKGLTKAEGAY